MRLALYQPDIPQNAGALIRLGACLDVPVELIEPAGFAASDRQLKRAALDYAPMATITRHRSWDAFEVAMRVLGGRLILLTTQATCRYADFAFAGDDVLLLGRESAGVPDHVHARADARVGIPLQAKARSLNVALAAAMVLGEALRQTAGFPDLNLRKSERT